MTACRRLQLELKEFEKLAAGAPVTASPVEGDLTHWKATLQGPEDTPYHGGVFEIDIKIPAEYPFTPPKMKFDTKIWHPNISSQTGCICLDVLGKEWSPALTIRTALISIQALLSAPEPDDPQDAVVAEMYKKTPDVFRETAKNWTEIYALEKKPSNNEEVEMDVTAKQEKVVGRALMAESLRRLRHADLEKRMLSKEPFQILRNRKLANEHRDSSVSACCSCSGCDGDSSGSFGKRCAMEHEPRDHGTINSVPTVITPEQSSQVFAALPNGLEKLEEVDRCSLGHCAGSQQYALPGLFALVCFMLPLIGLKKFSSFQARFWASQQPLMRM